MFHRHHRPSHDGRDDQVQGTPARRWLVELRGEVVYEQPGTGFGVLFVNIAEPNRKQLEWLVKAEAYRAEKQEPEF